MNWEKDTKEGRAYVAREREEFRLQLQRSERGKRGEKRAALAEWRKDVATDPELVAERIEWLLAGHYGKGAYDAAWEAVNSEFVKPASTLIGYIATLEWSVPYSTIGTIAYHPTEYADLVAAVERVIMKAAKEE